MFPGYRIPDLNPGLGQMRPMGPMPNQPQMMQGPSPYGQAPQGMTFPEQGYQPSYDGIGMMSMLMPMLMGVMQPGMGGFSGIGNQPQLPPPSPRMIGAGMPSAYSPQPTGGINRGAFSF